MGKEKLNIENGLEVPSGISIIIVFQGRSQAAASRATKAYVVGTLEETDRRERCI